MPAVSFDTLPDDARVWVFAATDSLDAIAADRLLAAVDDFLTQWHAHGSPLSCARDWRDTRFLAVGVDQSTAGASGCSIDGLFRTLMSLQRTLGTSLVGGGRVFYRDTLGDIRCVDREQFGALAAAGSITTNTRVFDTTVMSAAAWRGDFEGPAGNSWHAELVNVAAK
jgi:hypothetical protein